MRGSGRSSRQSQAVGGDGRCAARRVPVAARLPEFRLPLRALPSLAVGAVLATGVPTDAEVELIVSGQQRFRAPAGRIGRRMAAADQRGPGRAVRRNCITQPSDEH